MKMDEFKKLMRLASDLDKVETILKSMREGDIVDISRYCDGIKLRIVRNDYLYPKLESLLNDFVAEVKKEIERIEVKPKEEE